MTTRQKAVFGGMGAICLSILKLIEAKFYLQATDTSSIIAAYLTYFGYIILGVAVGCIFCEEHQDVAKTRKSAFVMGLLAPSILLATLSSPEVVTAPPEVRDSPPPSIHVDEPSVQDRVHPPQTRVHVMDLLFPPAMAQDGTASATTPEVIEVSAGDISTGISGGIRAALGIEKLSNERVVFLAGSTTNRAAAVQTAEQVAAFLDSKRVKEGKVVIYKPTNRDMYYISIGEFGGAARAAQIEDKVRKAASVEMADRSSPNPESQKTAKMLSKGGVYKSEVLFPK